MWKTDKALLARTVTFNLRITMWHHAQIYCNEFFSICLPLERKPRKEIL